MKQKTNNKIQQLLKQISATDKQELYDLIKEAQTQNFCDGIFLLGGSDDGLSKQDLLEAIAPHMDPEKEFVLLELESQQDDQILMGMLEMEVADELQYDYSELANDLFRSCNKCSFETALDVIWKQKRIKISYHSNKEPSTSTSDSTKKLQGIINLLEPAEIQKLKDLLEFPNVKEDVEGMLANGDVEEDLSDDEIEWVASQYVFEKRYDCNKSYWENLMSLINEAIQNR